MQKQVTIKIHLRKGFNSTVKGLVAYMSLFSPFSHWSRLMNTYVGIYVDCKCDISRKLFEFSLFFQIQCCLSRSNSLACFVDRKIFANVRSTFFQKYYSILHKSTYVGTLQSRTGQNRTQSAGKENIILNSVNTFMIF